MLKRLSLIIFIAIILFLCQRLFVQRYSKVTLISPSTSLRQPLPTIAPIHSPTPVPVAQIGLMGDLGLGRHITSTARAKNDFSWSFGGVTSWLTQSDFNLANLESPIIAKCPEGKTGTFTFCGDNRFLPYLQQNKFVLNLNNNHILNYGRDGLVQTQNYLKTDYFFDNFYQKTVKGITFGFLGYDFVTYPNLSQREILQKVAIYDPQVDWLVVSIHWGNEYLPKSEAWRVNLAHDLVDAGADIIHGHHPHVLQPVEIYKDKPIFYSLGNFIFDQSWSYETSHSEMVRLTLDKTKVLDVKKVPITIKHNSRPEISP